MLSSASFRITVLTTTPLFSGSLAGSAAGSDSLAGSAAVSGSFSGSVFVSGSLAGSATVAGLSAWAAGAAGSAFGAQARMLNSVRHASNSATIRFILSS